MALTREEQIRIGLAGSRLLVVEDTGTQDQQKDACKGQDQSSLDVEHKIEHDPENERR